MEQTIKAGPAIVSAALVSALIMPGLLQATAIQAIILSYIVAFVSCMPVNDLQPRERQHSMRLAAVPFSIAPFLVGIVRARRAVPAAARAPSLIRAPACPRLHSSAVSDR